MKVHIINLVSEKFQPYINEWNSKEDDKDKNFTQAMSLADNKVHNLLHDFRIQEFKKYR